MRLRLDGIEANCIIGDLPDERERLQSLRVDVELEIADTSARTDALADTVDYAALVERVRAALVGAQCHLIERAAKIVHDTCRADARVTAVRVTVTKTGRVPGLASASATFESEGGES